MSDVQYVDASYNFIDNGAGELMMNCSTSMTRASMTGKREKNKLPPGIRLGCWLCKVGILKRFCKICPPLT
jgi:hypothetical protein